MTTPLRIVMIEDDDGHARLIEKNIRRAGVGNDIQRFATGQAGLDYLAGIEATPELLILLDLNLPDMTGVDILEKVKAKERLKAVPVIVLTTTDDADEVNRCYELGCSVYVTKPVSYEDFAQAIQRLGLFLQVVRGPSVPAD